MEYVVFRGLGIDLKDAELEVKPTYLMGVRSRSEGEFLMNLAANTNSALSCAEFEGGRIAFGVEPVFSWEENVASFDDDNGNYSFPSSYDEAITMVARALVGFVRFKKDGREASLGELRGFVKPLTRCAEDIPFV